MSAVSCLFPVGWPVAIGACVSVCVGPPPPPPPPPFSGNGYRWREREMIYSFRPLLAPHEGVQADDRPPHSTYYSYAYEQENLQTNDDVLDR